MDCEGRVPSFKGKGSNGLLGEKGILYSDVLALRNWRDLPSDFGGGLERRSAAVRGALRLLGDAAQRMSSTFREQYPNAGIVLRCNNYVSNSLLRWRFTTARNGKGDVEFDDRRVIGLLNAIDHASALEWIRYEERRLELNHVIALFLYEQRRLTLFEKRLAVVRLYRRNRRDGAPFGESL